MDNEQAEIVGQLIALTWRLDIRALEQYLENPPKGFHYTRFCKAAVTFAQTVNNYSE